MHAQHEGSLSWPGWGRWGVACGDVRFAVGRWAAATTGALDLGEGEATATTELSGQGEPAATCSAC